MSRILTLDQLQANAASTSLVRPALIRARTTDNAFGGLAPSALAAIAAGRFQTYDAATYDSVGAFLIGELERLDPTIHAPLVNYTWSRDMPIRTDVSMGHDFSSFTNSGFAATGGANSGGKAWASKVQTETPNVALDISKTSVPLTPWAMEVSYTMMELASAMLTQRPVDVDKLTAMRLKWNMDVDEMTYIGDTLINGGVPGLVNNTSAITPANVANGAASSPLWTSKTPDEIVADFNSALSAAWLASGYAVIPNVVLLPPAKFAYLVGRRIGDAAQMSILDYVLQNNIAKANGVDLDIRPVKWLTGRGASSTDRMVAYNQDQMYVRMPLVPFANTPVQYRGIYVSTTYYGRLAQPEFVYPETIVYRDGF